MAEIKKSLDKREYKIADFTTVRSQVLIGGKDETTGGKCVPNLNISWDAETGSEKWFLNLNRKGVVVGDETETLSDEKLSLATGDIWRFDKGGNLKWDVEYKTDPRPTGKGDHVEEWELLTSPGVEFFYQPELTPETDPLGAGERPEHVVGSYAVYCDKQWNYPHAKYYTGKLTHIFRPLCIDANKKTWWAELHISKKDGILRITIPAECLDKAVYPLVLDPTIGYSGEGASSWTLTGYTIGNETTADGDGTITDINIYCKNTTGTDDYDIKIAALDDSGGTPTNLLAAYVTHTILQAESSYAWHQVAYSGSITNGATYYCVANNEVGGVNIAYDAGTAEYKSESYASSITGGGSWTDSSSYKMSIYCNATAAGGQTLLPTGTTSGVGLGAHTLSLGTAQTLIPGGATSGLGLGSHTLASGPALAIYPDGATSGIGFGTHTLTAGPALSVKPDGAVSGVGLGTHTLAAGPALILLPDGVASGLGLGTHLLSNAAGGLVLYPTGIVSGVGFGAPTLSKGSAQIILPAGVKSGVGLGTHTVAAESALLLLPAGVASGLGLGLPALSGPVVPVTAIEIKLYNVLTDSATLTGLVSSSVYPDQARQGAALPSVVYNRVSGVRIHSLSGYSNLENPRFQVNIYSAAVDDLADVQDAIIGALSSATNFQAIPDDSPHDYWDDQVGVYVRMFDVSLWNKE